MGRPELGGARLGSLGVAFALVVLPACGGVAARPVRTDHSYGSDYLTRTPATRTVAGANGGAADEGGGDAPVGTGGTAPVRHAAVPSAAPAQNYPAPKPIPTRAYLSVRMLKDSLPYSNGDPTRDPPYLQTLSIVTEVNSDLSVTVIYADGRTKYGGTTSGRVTGGSYTDSWQIDRLTPKGTVSVVVTATGSSSATWHGAFEVTDNPPHPVA